MTMPESAEQRGYFSKFEALRQEEEEEEEEEEEWTASSVGAGEGGYDA